MRRLRGERIAWFVVFAFAVWQPCIGATVEKGGELDPTDPTAWNSTTRAYIGKTTFGSMTLSAGTINSNYGYIGNDSAASGLAIVSGSTSQWKNSSNIYVGNYGSGTLNVTSGGSVSNTFGYVGGSGGSASTGTINGTTSKGMVTVSGSSSTWTNTSQLIVGDIGNGTLDITDGGVVSCGSVTGSYSDCSRIGYNANSTGAVTVSGAGSKWINKGALTIGQYGSGTLNILNGGSVSSTIGCLGNSTCDDYTGTGMATVTVSGIDSTWTVGGSIYSGLYVGSFACRGTLESQTAAASTHLAVT